MTKKKEKEEEHHHFVTLTPHESRDDDERSYFLRLELFLNKIEAKARKWLNGISLSLELSHDEKESNNDKQMRGRKSQGKLEEGKRA